MSQSQKDEIEETVDSLKTTDEILTYLKDLYAQIVVVFGKQKKENIIQLRN